MPTFKCPHCNQPVNAASVMGKIVTPAKIVSNTENAKKPRPGAKGKAKPRKAKEVSE